MQLITERFLASIEDIQMVCNYYKNMGTKRLQKYSNIFKIVHSGLRQDFKKVIFTETLHSILLSLRNFVKTYSV